jgi:hypothetical protein
MICGEWATKDHDERIRIIHRALDAGITFVDTADVYSGGESEGIVGKALAGRRADIVLATKAFMPMSDNLSHRGSSRHWIIDEAEASLRRLGTDWIDLYQIHRRDPETDLDETLGALSDLVHQGKIRYFGHSTFPASAIVEAQWTAQRRNRESASSPSSRPTRSSPAASRPTSSPRASATAWAYGRRWAAAGGQRVTFRLDGLVAHILSSGTLARTVAFPVPDKARARLRGARPGARAATAARAPPGQGAGIGPCGVIMVGGQRIQVGLAHAGKTASATVETDTCRITVDGEIVITARRTTSRDLKQHKASNYAPSGQACPYSQHVRISYDPRSCRGLHLPDSLHQDG